jgi:hypothetical protein
MDNSWRARLLAFGGCISSRAFEVMTDPFPELPRRVLFVDVTKPVTKPKDVTKIPVTKIDGVTKIGSRGRPAKSGKPMTAAERKRQSRAAKRIDR